MKKYLTALKTSCLVVLLGLFITSCNKDLESFATIPTPTYPSGSRVATTLAANSNYSFYNALITRADSGLVGSGHRVLLNDSTKSFTLFATDNAGMKLFINNISGGLVPLTAPDANFLGFINTQIPVASARGIVQYNTVGQKFPTANWSTAFPNYPLTSQIVLDPTQPFVRMPIFPVRGGTTSYVNTMPVTAPEIVATNGIIHTTLSLVAPLPASPTVTTLRTLINADANLTYFKAAIARADSGQVGISGVGPYGLQFDSLMNYPITNMTVVAPNNAAFQTLIFGLVYSQVLTATGSATIATTQANAAVAAGPAFLSTNNVSTALVRGIVAYHIFASNNTGSYKPDIRAFSVNFSPTPNSFVKTLVNGSVAAHLGIMAQTTFTGPIVSALKFTGLGTFPPGGAPFSGAAANATSWDKMALNGVMHVIDRVLLPQ